MHHRMRRRAQPIPPTADARPAFTLIELLVVISIITLLISILLPSVSRARDQAKSVHCLAKLKDFGSGFAAYENISAGVLPPARWFPNPSSFDDRYPPPEPNELIEYGWAEILFSFIYQEEVRIPESYAVQRNLEGDRWQQYFTCKAVGDEGISSGHYRVYLPAWSTGQLQARGGPCLGGKHPRGPLPQR